MTVKERIDEMKIHHEERKEDRQTKAEVANGGRHAAPTRTAK